MLVQCFTRRFLLLLLHLFPLLWGLVFVPLLYFRPRSIERKSVLVSVGGADIVVALWLLFCEVEKTGVSC